ncbi:MAG: YkvA family protein [Rhodanobacteraceae bacterium]
MRITFELEPADIERFQAALARARAAARSADEIDVVDAAKYALDHLLAGAAPGYVRKRLPGVQQLILMIEDDDWALPDPERADVIETLVYFSDPEDLIPDDVEVIGLLDDAIMLELLLRRLRYVLTAYSSFCAFRAKLGRPLGTARHAHAAQLAAQRRVLQNRMRRARKRYEASRDATIR